MRWAHAPGDGEAQWVYEIGAIGDFNVRVNGAAARVSDRHGTAVSIRPLLFDDWLSIHAWSQSEDLYRFQVWGPSTSNVETRRFVETALSDGAHTPRTRFVWCAEHGDGRVIGIAELRVHDPRSECAGVSYVVDPHYWGRGYATQMANWVVDFAFGELGMHRVEATCDRRNAASAAVLRKLGMHYEGRARENVKLRDGWRDSELFGVLHSEWLLHASPPPTSQPGP